MKKALLIIFLSSFLFSYSQEKENISLKKNEIKGNALFLILGTGEITYERLLDEESGIGASLFVPFDSGINPKFSLTTYYRFYFGAKPASGFFVEGFGMLNSNKINDIYLYNQTPQMAVSGTITDFALGFGIGGKWITKKGFLFEINSGIGRNLFNQKSGDYGYQIVGRGGITIGYRY